VIYIIAKYFKRYLQGVFYHDLFLLPVEKLHHFLNPRKDKIKISTLLKPQHPKPQFQNLRMTDIR